MATDQLRALSGTSKGGQQEKHAAHVSALSVAKIRSIEYFRVKPRWLFVKVTDDQGGYGWGEGTLEGHTQAVEGALDEIIDRIIGYEAE
jgi:hypothetical protein